MVSLSIVEILSCILVALVILFVGERNIGRI
jgi:hypothetical protein